MSNTTKLNELELSKLTPFKASWHQDYIDTSSIYIGGLPQEMNEMDILIMFSQYGVPLNIKLMRNKITGESLKYAFLKYEQFESCVLAIDNFNNWEIIPGKKLKVDHVIWRGYKYDDEVVGGDANKDWDIEVEKVLNSDIVKDDSGDEIDNAEIDEDPMAGYLKDKERRMKSRRSKSDRSHRSHRSQKKQDDNNSDSHSKIGRSSRTHRHGHSQRHSQKLSDNDKEKKPENRSKSPERS